MKGILRPPPSPKAPRRATGEPQAGPVWPNSVPEMRDHIEKCIKLIITNRIMNQICFPCICIYIYIYIYLSIWATFTKSCKRPQNPKLVRSWTEGCPKGRIFTGSVTRRFSKLTIYIYIHIHVKIMMLGQWDVGMNTFGLWDMEIHRDQETSRDIDKVYALILAQKSLIGQWLGT